jgi:hypothetical protein
MTTLLDYKLSTYIITPHGVTKRGDSNTTTVPKNCHIFAMGVHEDTYFSNPIGDPVEDYFQGIRNLWKTTLEKKHSINQVIDNLILSTGLRNDAEKNIYNKFAYYPPGCLIRNLRLVRDRGAYPGNIDGIFKLGDQIPCALITKGPLDNPKEYDSPEYNKLYRFGETKDAFKFIKTHEDEYEQKIIIVLACAGEAPEEPLKGFAAGEGKLIDNINRTIYDSIIKQSEIKFIKFFPNLEVRKREINYILEHNLAFNQKLHISIDIPIRCIPKKEGKAIGELCFKFRSKRSFNMLLTPIKKIKTIMKTRGGEVIEGLITPTYFLIKDKKIYTIVASNITDFELPYTLIKIPKDFESYLYSPTYDMVQFFNNYKDDTPFITPPESPGKLIPSGILGGYYYNKYLKYKNKYLTIKDDNKN